MLLELPGGVKPTVQAHFAVFVRVNNADCNREKTADLFLAQPLAFFFCVFAINSIIVGVRRGREVE